MLDQGKKKPDTLQIQSTGIQSNWAWKMCPHGHYGKASHVTIDPAMTISPAWTVFTFSTK